MVVETGRDPWGEDVEELHDWLGGWAPDDFDLEAARRAFDRPKRRAASRQGKGGRASPKGKGRRPKARAADPVEWLGALATLPVEISEEGQTYRPEALVWLGPGELILGADVAPPGTHLDTAADHLAQVMARPLAGDPTRPDRVRVASEELAGALRAGHPDLKVVCAPTPEVDAILGGFLAHLAEHFESGPPLLPEVEPARLASYFSALADLYRAAPWRSVPGDSAPVSLTIEALELPEAVIAVMGGLGREHGLLFFDDLEVFDLFVDGARALERGEHAPMPGYLALTYERAADFEPEVRGLVGGRAVELAGPAAFPVVMVVDGIHGGQPPVRRGPRRRRGGGPGAALVPGGPGRGDRPRGLAAADPHAHGAHRPGTPRDHPGRAASGVGA